MSRTQVKPKRSKVGGIIVGYLSGGDTRIEFTRSIGSMTAYSLTHGIPLVGALPHISGPRIAAGRNHLVESFLATDAEWLFMVDDDMSFDGNVLERFLAVADPVERPIVGGLAFATGRDGIFPTLFRVHPELQIPTRLDVWPPGEVVEVDGTGAACMFIHRSVFEKMAENFEKPWQWFQETTMNGNTVGEDMTFCLRARSLGFPIVVDTGNRFGHVKPRIIDEDEYFRWIDTHRFVITGPSPSPLKRIGTTLLFCRVKCGWEDMFSEDGVRSNPFLRGDASWYAPPLLDRFSGFVLHVVSHPLVAVAELEGLLGDREVAVRHYLDTNRLLDERAHRRVRVEDVTGSELYDVVRFAGAMHAPWEIQANLDAVGVEDVGRLEWSDIPDEVRAELELMAKEYGYDI